MRLDEPRLRLEELSRLDPGRIYVENVRSILGITTSEALKICEDATRHGLFGKMVEARCPDGTVAASATNARDLPETVHCWFNADGHIEEVEVSTKTLELVNFYVLSGE